jgi:NADPH2:quinone reductase
MQELVGWYMEGKVKPLIEGTYPLADAARVLERIHSRGAVGKLVLRP